MPEWLTTGQMIDRLKVGERAESVAESPPYKVTRTNKGIVFSDGNPLVINTIAIDEKWRILPSYVSFEEAMKALKEGKKVKVLYDNGEHDYIFHYSREIYFRETTWMDLLDGKWTIEADTHV